MGKICLFVLFFFNWSTNEYNFTFLMKMLLCFRPRCFRLYLFNRRKPKSRQLRVSRTRRQWPTSSSSSWSSRSRGPGSPARPPNRASSWASLWGSARTFCRWGLLTCSRLLVRDWVSLLKNKYAELVKVEVSALKMCPILKQNMLILINYGQCRILLNLLIFTQLKLVLN